MPNGASQDMIDAVVPLWNQGYGVYQICEMIQVANQTVYRALHAVGIYPDHTGSKPFPQEYPELVIEAAWALEFRGLFMGEGCAAVHRRLRNNGKGTYAYLPNLSVGARSDNHEMIENIQSVLGGKIEKVPEYVNQDGRKFNPQLRWYVNGWGTVRAIIEVTNLCESYLGASKTTDVAIVYEAILARFAMPQTLGPSHRTTLETYYLRGREQKRFQL